MPAADYLDALVRCYEDEIVNEAYFLAVAQRLPSAAHRDKLALLGEVERRAAAAVRPLLASYGVVPRPVPVLHAQGAAELESDRISAWRDLLERIVDEYSHYVEQFRALERIAPAADRAALAQVTAHEAATIEFARRESAGERDSLGPIRVFLDH